MHVAALVTLGSLPTNAHAEIDHNAAVAQRTFSYVTNSPCQCGYYDGTWRGVGGEIMPRVQLPALTPNRKACNKGRIISQQRPLAPAQVLAIDARLELAGNLRD